MTANSDATTLVNELLGNGITVVGTPTYTGAANASGLFTDGDPPLGIDSGVILTTGTATDAEGPNLNFNDSSDASDDTSTANGEAGDPDLTNLGGLNTFDASVLEFEFQFGDGSTGGDLFFNYVFASEEYNEFVGGGVNDIFALFVNGTNVALVPGTTDFVSVDTVNNGVNSSFFNDNTSTGSFGSSLDIEYDGFTDVFTAQALNLPAGTNTLKLAIADAGDSILDSALLIEGDSISESHEIPFEAESALGLAALVGLIGVRKLRQRKSSNVEA